VKAGERVNADDALDFVIALGVTELEARLQREGRSGVTVDQLVKAIGEKTRRKSSDAQRELLGARMVDALWPKVKVAVIGPVAGARSSRSA
jgi:hypothetical protein